MSRGTQRRAVPNAVIPAKAGIHFELTVATWIPAFAEMTKK